MDRRGGGIETSTESVLHCELTPKRVSLVVHADRVIGRLLLISQRSI